MMERICQLVYNTTKVDLCGRANEIEWLIDKWSVSKKTDGEPWAGSWGENAVKHEHKQG